MTSPAMRRPGTGGLHVASVDATLGATRVLSNVTVHVPAGELHALLGASGSGKTTLLRVVAGLTDAESGSVTIDGDDVTALRPEERRVGIVFQNYALFPHLSVADNITFGPRLAKMPRAERRRILTDTCETTRVPRNLLRRKPSELSGGQQQRVAIARALATRPTVLLLDEPLAALDRKVRREVRVELRRIQRDLRITTIFVTHDQEEALYVADRVLVMDRGRIVQGGPGAQVYAAPESMFVANFVGETNVLPADLDWHAHDDPELVSATIDLGGRRVRVDGCLASPTASAGRAARGLLAIRPEQIVLRRNAAGPNDGTPPSRDDAVTAAVRAIDFAGATATVQVSAGRVTLSALVLSREVLGPGRIDVGHTVTIEFAAGCTVLADDRESAP